MEKTYAILDWEQPSVELPGSQVDDVGLFAEFAHHPKKRLYLIALAQTGSNVKATRAVPCCVSLPFVWYANDPAFKAACITAKKLSTYHLEDTVLERIENGERRMKFNKDGEAIIDPTTGQPYVETTYNVAREIFMLKCRNPEMYGDKTESTVNANVNHNIKQLEELIKSTHENDRYIEQQRTQALEHYEQSSVDGSGDERRSLAAGEALGIVGSSGTEIDTPRIGVEHPVSENAAASRQE